MKLIQSTVKGIEYKFICLENDEDMFTYQVIDEQIKSKQACNFWFGFKTHSFRKSPFDYALHETEGNNNLPHFLALQLEFSEKEVSIVDYTIMADKMIDGIHKTMMKLINQGYLVRINKKGGYCNIKKEELSDYHTKIDINEQQLYCFLLNGEINKEYNITSENLIIENGNYVDPSFLANLIEKSGESNIQILDYFKQNTLLFKEEDYVKFFNDGITNYNLKNIGFQTTAQDTVQVSNVKKVIEYVMSKHTDKTLNVYIKTYSNNKSFFETKLKNVNIIYL